MMQTHIHPKPKKPAGGQARRVKIGDVMVTLRPHPGKGTLSRSQVQEIVEAARQEMLSSR